MSDASVRVLHVDDDPEFGSLTATFLEREDDRLSVETATSTAKGLDLIRELSPDCVVSDYDMPGQNGIEFLERVRNEWPELPFILFTGKGSEEVAGQAVSAGVTDYLQKKSGSEQYTLLANRIINAVERRQASKALAQTRTRHQSLRTELIELSIELLQSEHTDIDSRVERAVERIGTHVAAHRSYVFQIDQTEETTSNTHEWCAEGVTPQIDSLQNIPLDTLPWWMEQLENFETITIPDVSELPAEASAEREILQEQNIRSVIVAPMVIDEELVGFIGFDWIEPQDVWNEEFVDILHITGRLVTSAFRQESRRNELERKEAYLEQSGDIISVTDDSGDVVYQSPSTEGVTGFSPADVVGQSGFEHIHPDDKEAAKKQFFSFLSQPGATLRTELRVETQSDSWRWIEIRGVNKLDDPIIDGLLFSSRDITERKSHEQDLREYETIVEALGDPVYVVDKEGQFRHVNDAFVELVGYDRETILGNTPSLIKAERAVETAEQQLGNLLSEEGPDTATFEVTIQPRTEEPLVCEDHMGVLPFEGDSFDASVGTLRDVTERKERARELEYQKNRLAELTSVVSNDLRNSLRIAEDRLELAQADCDSSQLNDVADAVDRTDALVEDLLTLARSGAVVRTAESVSLPALAEGCWEVGPEGSATLTVETDLTVLADRSRLRQLLEHLFTNATEHGPRNVTVRVGSLTDGFYVADDGAGVPERERADIFESGYSTAEGKTGFGLRIVKQIVDAHCWDIRVTDSEDGGARFEITGVETPE